MLSPRPHKRPRHQRSSSLETVRPERCRTPNLTLSDAATQITDAEDLENDDEEDEEEQYTILAIDYKKKKLGCAFYKQSEDKLYLVTDVDINLYGGAQTVGNELYNACESSHVGRIRFRFG